MRRVTLMAGLLVVGLAAAGCGSTGGDVNGPVQVATVLITPESGQIAATETASFTAEARDANNSVLTGKTFTFSSTNSAVATVADPAANPATVTAVADGVVTITATTEGKSGSAILTVSGHPRIQVAGRVVDGATGLGIAVATIDFEWGLGDGSGHTVTGGDGSFSLTIPWHVDGAEILNVTAGKTGYVSTTLHSFARAPSDQLETILLVQQTSVKGAISGTVRNARTNQGIPRVPVELHRGQWTLTFNDPSPRHFESDSNGGFSFTGLDAGTYTLLARAPQGFHPNSRTAVTVTSGAAVAQDLILSPEGANGIVVVLTWGANPSDLDAHLTGPNTDASRFHVSYLNRGNLTAAPFAALDVDDVQSFGPETITITQLNSGVYRYSVHDFSNRSSAASSALGASGAKVELWIGAQGRTFFVPNQPGTLWTVFELSGNITSPAITVRNSMGVAQDPGGILAPARSIATSERKAAAGPLGIEGDARKVSH